MGDDLVAIIHSKLNENSCSSLRVKQLLAENVKQE